MRRSIAQILASVALCVTLASVTEAVTIVSNLGNALSGSAVVQDNFWVAQSFTTNNASYMLDSITVKALGNDSSSEIEFLLYDDVANQPGSAINSLSGPGTPTIFTDYTYAPTAPVTLDASTKYWVVARALAGDGDYRWVRTLDVFEVGPGTLGGRLGSGDQGLTWGIESTDSASFLSVEGTVVPEPSTLVLAVLGLAGLAVFVRTRHKRT